MNKRIREQLIKSKLIIQDVGENKLFIPKQEKPVEPTFEVQHYYIIQLEEYLLHPGPDFSLFVNWDKGVVPQSLYMKCQVLKKMGKMIQINGCGYEPVSKVDGTDFYYDYWLPEKSVKLIQEI